ncbi:hypothetical protein O3M35_007023 [Rhynocoris fuscipes]|uniref:Uncharacterized protein n=1 Tax=Rhynocoris fuscipes TaxID=488301 RepID=A0AAW1DLI2_9HEMI
MFRVGIGRSLLRRLQWLEDGEEHKVRHGKHRPHAGVTRRNQTLVPSLARAKRSCYTGNEVLAIIAVTCVLNFAFVLIIMACVHYCTHAGSSHKSNRVYRFFIVAWQPKNMETQTSCSPNRVLQNGTQ